MINGRTWWRAGHFREYCCFLGSRLCIIFSFYLCLWATIPVPVICPEWPLDVKDMCLSWIIQVCVWVLLFSFLPVNRVIILRIRHLVGLCLNVLICQLSHTAWKWRNQNPSMVLFLLWTWREHKRTWHRNAGAEHPQAKPAEVDPELTSFSLLSQNSNG